MSYGGFMMNIRGYSWAGTPASDFDKTNHFFKEILGLELLMRDDKRMIGIFKLPNGQLFEVTLTRLAPNLKPRVLNSFQILNGVRTELPGLSSKDQMAISTSYFSVRCNKKLRTLLINLWIGR